MSCCNVLRNTEATEIEEVTIPQAVWAVATYTTERIRKDPDTLQYRKRYELLQPLRFYERDIAIWLQYRKRYELLQLGYVQ